MTKAWYVRQDNSVYGPYGSRRLKEMAINGEISPACEVANNQNGPWFAVDRLKGIEFAAAPPPKRITPVETVLEVLTSKSTGNVQTIELTSKKYKLMQLIGLGIGIPSAAICIYAMLAKSSTFFALGLSIFVVAFLITLTGALLAWWHHG